METTIHAQVQRITVIGTGYLGATHAACMASLGFDVLGVDVDQTRIDSLNAGDLPFHEPELPELLRAELASGRLRFTTSYDEAAAFGQVHFICVGTPQQRGSQAADMTYVDASVTALASRLSAPALIVGKSTVPVGTAERLQELVNTMAPAGTEVAWNPEFLREGFAVADSLHPDRLVFGVAGPLAEPWLRQVFATPLADNTPLVVTDMATAQLVKVAANSFLATKISFINAMAEVCEATGADVQDLSRALSHDERIGGKFLRPGVGFGGGCLPKDIRAFQARSRELGVERALGFLNEVDGINLRRRTRVVDLARDIVGGDLNGRRVAVLGASFKPNSDDIRDSPALDVAVMLHGLGADVVVHDPIALTNAKRAKPDLQVEPDIAKALTGAEVVLVLTEWSQFSELEPRWVGRLVASPRVIDARNALDAQRWHSAGFDYYALGRPSMVHGVAAATVDLREMQEAR